MRFVVCGEALIDLIGEPGADPTVSTWRAHPGGGPLNTAVALARLGADCRFLGRLGGDAFGRQMDDYLGANGVDRSLVVRDAAPTLLAVVSVAGDGQASYVFHTAETATCAWQQGDFPTLTSDDWLHFGSIGAVLDPGADALARFVANTPAALSYDLNVRTSLLSDVGEYWERVDRLMTSVGQSGGVVRASDVDIAELADASADEVDEVAEQWCAEYGFGLFVVTHGAGGAVAIKPDGRRVHVEAPRVEVVDTVGAGDTFTAGFLTRYVERPDDVESALRMGVAAAALACQRAGATPPTRDEVDAVL